MNANRRFAPIITHRNMARTVVLGLLAMALLIAVAVFWLSNRPSPAAGEAQSTGAQTSSAEAAARLQRAWQTARASGVYRFRSEVTQTTFPAPRVANVGRSSRTETMYIEGETNLTQERFYLAMWPQGGNAVTASAAAPQAGAIEMRIEGGVVYARQDGQAWRKVDDITPEDLSDKDALTYLLAARNVRPVEAGDWPNLEHYTFELDGPLFARQARDRLEASLRRGGKLPVGFSLDASNQFIDMTGQGEAWLDEAGLPVRLAVHIHFPPTAEGERIEADFRTDYMGFDATRVSAFTAPGWGERLKLAFITQTERLSAHPQQTAAAGLLIGGYGVLIALLLFARRNRWLHAGVAGIVILSMLVSPVAQGKQASAFAADQAAQQEAYAAQQGTEQAIRELQASDWDAHRSPLAAPPAGEPNSQNSAAGAQPAAAGLGDALAAPSFGTLLQPDSEFDADGDDDGDGLNNGDELYRLGTNYAQADSDGDGLSDGVEVTGFAYNGKQWYLNPKNLDTNGDNLPDSIECPDLAANPPGSACLDTDNDGAPDVFDLDNDDDDVFDAVDLSPYGALDAAGLRSRGAAITPFDAANPFALNLGNLTPGEPVLVDIQLRPNDPKHLAYALSVLDWPNFDQLGQVQHVKTTTFATTDHAASRNLVDPAAAFGDIRLTPMLEVEIGGSEAPLPLTLPAFTVHTEGSIAATLSFFTQENGDRGMRFESADSAAYTVEIFSGNCKAIGDLPQASFSVTNGASVGVSDSLTALADGDHALQVSRGADRACVNLPNMINGPYREKMIDGELLQSFGISVREKSQGGPLLLYVPLNVVSGDSSGERVAFQARLFYQPETAGAWRQAQQMRVVWLVQMLTDTCDLSGFTSTLDPEEQADQYTQAQRSWCALNRTPDQPQVVQTYPDAWWISGMSVREDHGVDVAVIYPDPAYSLDDAAENGLWQIAYGLSRAFVARRDCEPLDANEQCAPNQRRDVAVLPEHGDSTISMRFDGDNTATLDERWGVDPALRYQVETIAYPHVGDLALLAMQENPRILAAFPTTSKPILLYAREEHSRSADMALGSVRAGVYSLDFSPSTFPETTLAAINWAQFRYAAESAGWQATPAQVWWDELGVALMEKFRAANPTDTEDVNAGRVVIARAFAFSMLAGLAGSVEGQGALEVDVSPEATPDAIIASQFTNHGTDLFSIVWDVVSETRDKFLQMKDALLKDPIRKLTKLSPGQTTTTILSALGKTTSDAYKSPYATLFDQKGGGRVGLGVAAFGAAAVIGIVITGAVLGRQNGAQVAQVVLAGVSTLNALHGAIKTAAETIDQLNGTTFKAIIGSSVKQAMKASLKCSAVIGLVIEQALSWVLMGVTVGLSHPSGFDIGDAIAGSIAATVVAVILFIIELIPVVGGIITAIIDVIDSLVNLLCMVFVPEDQQESGAVDWFCGGITGILENILKYLVFSHNNMVDLSDNRLIFGDFEIIDFSQPEMGFSAGNSLSVSLEVTTKIHLLNVGANMGALWAYEFSQGNLRTSTFEYALGDEEIEGLEENLSRKTMLNEWQPANDEDGSIYATRNYRSEMINLPLAGLNRRLPLVLSEGYAVPVQMCVLGICALKTERGAEHYNIGDSLYFDVFPATLDEFAALVPQGGSSLRLGWDQRFPALKDADSDGLPATGGADPDDTRWDADGDGFGDLYETQIGSDPNRMDGDGDGLTDPEEMRLGASPTRTDTDGDGLWDGEEALHQDLLDSDGDGDRVELLGGWLFRASPSLPDVWVTSDPRLVDTDEDQLTDRQEQTFGFNPRWVSNPNVLSLDSQIQEQVGGEYTHSDSIVAPGQTFYYQATVRNELANRSAQGLLTSDFPPGLNPEQVPPASFVLGPQESQVMQGEVPVRSTAATGVYNLTQVAGALVTDWSALSGNARWWLPFEDAVGATSFADRSGSAPTHPAACQGGGCQMVKDDGAYGGAVRLDGDSAMQVDFNLPWSDAAISLWFKTSQPDAGLLETDRVQIALDAGQVSVDLRDGRGSPMEQYLSELVCNDDRWHNLVFTWGPMVPGNRLYLGGQLAGTGQSTLPTNGVLLRIGAAGSAPNWDGLLDEARVYNHAFTLVEAMTLNTGPSLDLPFSETEAYTDHSAFNHPVAAPTPAAAPQSAPGIHERGVQGDGHAFLEVSGAENPLDLTHGGLTLAAWVYPMTSGQGEAYDRAYQGVLGNGMGAADGYPSLLYNGENGGLVFGFGDGNAWREIARAGVLPRQRWSHVAVTFDDDADIARGYVNGQPVFENSAVFAGAGVGDAYTSLLVGRSSRRFSVQADNLYVDRGGAFLCVTLDGQVIFDGHAFSRHPMMDKPMQFDESAELIAWEGSCQVIPGPNDPVSLRYTFTPDAVSTDAMLGFQGVETEGFSGNLHIIVQNHSVPFYGRMDEVQVYPRRLSPEEIGRLYTAADRLLNVRFDEPPGASVFSAGEFSAATGGVELACSRGGAGADCPTAGVPGRENQAAWFHGDQVVVTGNSEINHLTRGFSLAAWIKPDTLSGYQRILSTAATKSNNGFGFGLDNDKLIFTQYGAADYRLADVSLPANVWTHVAVAVTDAGEVRFFMNGEFKGELPKVRDGKPDWDDMLAVGARPTASGLVEKFAGRIDELYAFQHPLSAAEALALYRRAPGLMLHFEEEFGATAFADSSGNSASVACQGRCPLTGDGVLGRIGRAVEFQADSGSIAVADNPALSAGAFSVSAWVLPVNFGAGNTLVSKGGDYTLGLESGSAEFRICHRQGLIMPPAKSQPVVVKNAWNHLVGVFDGRFIKVYVNGSLQGVVDTGLYAPLPYPIPCSNSAPVTLSGGSTYQKRLDEVAYYGYALSDREIRSLYQYQSAWVEARQSQSITIDADPPTVGNPPAPIAAGRAGLAAQVQWTWSPPSQGIDTPSYLPNRDVQMLIRGFDATSSIAAAALGVRAPGAAGFAWSDAPLCQDSFGDSAWCPTFTPSGAGRYELKWRLTDAAGNTAEAPSTQAVWVDGAAPDVSIAGAGGAFLEARRHSSQAYTWQVSFSGAANDPAESASGVPQDGVWVSVFDAQGRLAGLGRQMAQLSEGAWSIDYLFDEAELSGNYTVRVEAHDAVAAAALDAGQAAAHTGQAELGFQLDTTRPAASLDLSDLPSGVITQPLVLRGGVNDRPAEVSLRWETDARGGELGLAVNCAGETIFRLPAGSFDDRAAAYTQTLLAHQGAACSLELSDAAEDGGTSGTIAVCGVQAGEWNSAWGAALSVPFSAVSSGCPSGAPISGVSALEAAFVPAAPGLAYVNDPLSKRLGAPPRLHLPFDDAPGAQGALSFSDLSPAGLHGACAGEACPLAAEPGRLGGSARFDGGDDAVRLPPGAAGDGVATLMAWVRPASVSGSHTILASGRALGAEDGFALSLADGRLAFSAYGKGQVTAPASSALPAGAWSHVAAVVSGAQVALWINGNPIADLEGSLSAAPAADDQDDLLVGAAGQPGGAAVEAVFAGWIDDLRVYPAELDAGELRAAIYGVQPLLNLPFDEAWAVDGDRLEETSGWDHPVELFTADANNKAIPGAAGLYGLAFDGQGDYVAATIQSPSGFAPAPAGLDGAFTQSAWVYPTPVENQVGSILSPDSPSRNAAPFLNVVNGTALQAGFSDGDHARYLTSEPVLAENTWNHVAATFDGTTYRLYVNGTAVAASNALSGLVPPPAWRYNVGRGFDPDIAAECGHLRLTNYTPLAFFLQHRIKVNGAVAWTSEQYPGGGRNLDYETDFCGPLALVIEGRSAVSGWNPLGANDTIQIAPTPGPSASYTFGVPAQASITWNVTAAANEMHPFSGRIDDVQMWAVALPPQAVQALYRSGWQPASLDGDGEQTAWSLDLPELTGEYILHLRSRDAAGNLEAPGPDLPQFTVDNQPPRLALTRQASGGLYYYQVFAEDFNLIRQGFRSPCGTTPPQAEDFAAPWYLALGGGGANDPDGGSRLFRLADACWAAPAGQMVYQSGYDPALEILHLAAGDGYAYAGSGTTLDVVEVRDPAAPKPVGQYQAESGIDSIRLAGGEAAAQATTSQEAARGMSLMALANVMPPIGAKHPAVRLQTNLPPGPDPIGGSGEFINSGQNLSAYSASDAALGDLDNDGDLDLFIASDNPAYDVWRNETAEGSTGVFTATTQPARARPFTSQQSLALGDLDSDGDLDAVLGTDRSGLGSWLPSVDVLINDGSGVFNDTDRPATGNVRTHSLTLADMDGDADLDLVMNANFGDGGSAAVQVWLNDGAGVFNDTFQVIEPLMENGVFDVGDLDSDGDVDLLVCHTTMCKVFHNDGAGQLTEGWTRNIGVRIFTAVDLGDLDNDGDLDAVLAYGASSAVWTNNGMGIFFEPSWFVGGNAYADISLGDVDGDGDLDAVTVSDDPAHPANEVRLNDGWSHFTAHGSLGSYGDVLDLPLGDVDNDGDLDGYVARGSANPGQLWFNDTRPDFTSAPVINAAEGVLYTYSVVAEDADNPPESMQIVAVTLPAWLSLVDHGDGTATLSGTPAQADLGSHPVSLMVTGARGLHSAQIFTVTVSEVSYSPGFTSTPTTSAQEDAPYTYVAAASDPDDPPESLAITAATLPGWLTLAANGDGTATLSGTPGPGDVGDHPVILQARDPGGQMGEQAFTIQVVSVNDAPYFTSAPPTSAQEGLPYSYTAAATDEDDPAAALTFTAVEKPGFLALVDHGDGTATLSGAPAQADVGEHPITLQVTDPAGQSGEQTFTLTVTNINNAPVFTSVPITTTVLGIGYDAVVVADDPDPGDTVAITALELPDWLALDNRGDGTATLSGDPAAGDLGEHTVRLQASDSGGTTAEQAFTVRVLRQIALVTQTGRGVDLVDVSDPATPRRLSTVQVPSTGSSLDIALADEPGARGLAYVVGNNTGLRVVDIQNPLAPVELAFFNTPTGGKRIAIAGNRAYVMAATTLWALDLTDAVHPTILGALYLTGLNNLAVGDGYVYLANGAAGVRVVDVRDPAHPTLVATFDTPVDVKDVALQGATLYVADYWNGLLAVNVSDPLHPVQLAQVDHNGSFGGYLWEVEANATNAYLAAQKDGLYVLALGSFGDTAAACDAYGNCATTDALTAGSAAAPETLAADDRTTTASAETATIQPIAWKPDSDPDTAAALPSALFDENGLSIAFEAPEVITSTLPVTITGQAGSTVSSLHNLVVTANGTPFHTQEWPQGQATDETWQALWTPTGAGEHRLAAQISDWAGANAAAAITVTVDLLPPKASLTTNLLTLADFHSPRTVDLEGTVSDDTGVRSVQVTVGGSAYPAQISGDTWRLPWFLDMDPLPDGDAFPVTIEAVDIAGRSATLSAEVTVDVVAPTAPILSVMAGGVPVERGAVVPAPGTSLEVTWEAVEAADLAEYEVTWLEAAAATPTVSATQVVPAGGPRTNSFALPDGRQVAVRVSSRDAHGNASAASFGPLYADGARTPAYLGPSAGGETSISWLEGKCNLLGVDRRTWSGSNEPQRLYATWSETTLGLAWTGAAPDGDAALFFYLDTAPGGATQAFNPNPDLGLDVTLPDGMQADWAVWGRSGRNAYLLHWDGGGWALAAMLDASQYRIHRAHFGWLTELTLPFDLLGISNPASASLGLLAFATPEATLRPWAALPNANPLNAPGASAPGTGAADDRLALSHFYAWSGLDGGVCPNGALDSPELQYGDVDLQWDLAADPAGNSLRLLGDGLVGLQELLLNGSPVEALSRMTFLNTVAQPVGSGRDIVYTLSYRNRGEATARGVYALVETRYALALSGGGRIDLGDLDPGAEGQVQIRARVDPAASPEDWGVLAIKIYDAAHAPGGQPLEWLWNYQPIDRDPPRFFGITDPVYTIPASETVLHGYAYDEAGISGVEVQVETPQGGTRPLNCPFAAPTNGVWTCPWDITQTNGAPPADGASFRLRARATDAGGQTSDWGGWMTLTVDSLGPQVALDAASARLLDDHVAFSAGFPLSGPVSDLGQSPSLTGVETCIEGSCAPGTLKATAPPAAYTLDDLPTTPVPLGASACGGGELARTFTVAEAFTVTQVRVGITAQAAPRGRLRVDLVSPTGTRVRLLDDDGSLSARFAHWDALLADDALADPGGDHNPAAPYFEHLTRPADPLRTFWGEAAQGDWSVHICDQAAGGVAGGGSTPAVYVGSQLTLLPQATLPVDGEWSAWVPAPDGPVDHQARVVQITATDGAGNRAGVPLTATVWFDNTPPAIVVDQALSALEVGETASVLGGTASDGGQVTDLFAHVRLPSGEVVVRPVGRDGASWRLELQAAEAGVYQLQVYARDDAGNLAATGERRLAVRAPQRAWTGSVSDDWRDPANWEGGRLPAIGQRTLIPPSPHDPVLTGAAQCGALIIQAGAALRLQGGELACSQGVELAGTLTFDAAGTLALGGDWDNDGSFDAGEGKVILAGATPQYIHGDTTFHDLTVANPAVVTADSALTVGGVLETQRGFLQFARGDFHDVAIRAGAALEAGGDLIVRGDFTNEGRFEPGSFTAAFEGAGMQTVFSPQPMAFHDLIVSDGVTLTTGAVIDVLGSFTNRGWIVETRTVEGDQTLRFNLAGVSVGVDQPGNLHTLEVARRDQSHPLAQPDLQTGRYWRITPNGDAAGYTLTLTMPYAQPDEYSRLCRYTGARWDCAASSFDAAAGTVTRNQVTSLNGGEAGSDWTIGQVENLAPVLGALTFAPRLAREGGAVTLSGEFADADPDDRHTASVDWGDAASGDCAVDQEANTLACTHTYADGGAYTSRVTVCDTAGESATGELVIAVEEAAPTAAFRSDAPKNEGQEVHFTDLSSDPTDSIVAWQWDFEYDGLHFDRDASVQNPVHVYPNEGTYTVALQVTDADGSTGFTTGVATITNLSDVTVTGFTANGLRDIRVTYTLADGDYTALTLGFYRSDDRRFGSGGGQLSTVTLTAPADLSAGTHVKTFTLGSTVRLVDDANETLGDYYLLAMADPEKRLAETDDGNNTAVFTGVYHPARQGVYVHGTEAADTLTASGGTVTLNGTRYTYTDLTSLIVRAHNGNDSLTANLNRPALLFGGSGNDTLRSQGASLDRLAGGAGDDSLYGGALIDFVYGEAGDDLLYGEASEDVLDGGEGADRAYGGPGYDLVYGGPGDDALFGENGVDALFGDAGADHLWGGGGDDLLYGQDGDDDLHGEANSDALVGGAGVDVLDGGTGGDVAACAGATQGCAINLSTRTVTNDGLGSADHAISGVENLIGGPYADTLIGDNNANTLLGMDGNDLLAGLGGGDTLTGGAGNDTLWASSDPSAGVCRSDQAKDFLYGGLGIDSAYRTAGQDIIYDVEKVYGCPR